MAQVDEYDYSQRSPLDMAQLSTREDMVISSEVVEPVVFNQRFVRFRLDNKGILDSGSRLQMAFTNASAAANVAGLRPTLLSSIKKGVHAY